MFLYLTKVLLYFFQFENTKSLTILLPKISNFLVRDVGGIGVHHPPPPPNRFCGEPKCGGKHAPPKIFHPACPALFFGPSCPLWCRPWCPLCSHLSHYHWPKSMHLWEEQSMAGEKIILCTVLEHACTSGHWFLKYWFILLSYDPYYRFLHTVHYSVTCCEYYHY